MYEKTAKGVLVSPLKDEFSHPQDCVQYAASHMFRFKHDPDREKRIKKELKKHEERLGNIDYGKIKPEYRYDFG